MTSIAARWLLFALSLAAVPSAFAAAPGTADADAMWHRFLADDKAGAAYDAYDILDAIDYDVSTVDAQACRTNADALDKAVAVVPVSIALHHAALLCAQATGNTVAAARESDVLDLLSNAALAQASDVDTARPIRVVSTQDAYTLLHIAGLDVTYEYYRSFVPARYFPWVIAAWDDNAKVERHLAFDIVDVAGTIIRDDPYSGFPYARTVFVDTLVATQAKHGQLLAIDSLAIRDAASSDDHKVRVAKFRGGAEQGGVQSAVAWILMCDSRPFDGCADGLVDALLPQAEKKYAMAMAMLAYAYAQGLGVEPDAAASRTLLAAADKRWPRGGASDVFASLWLAGHAGDATPAVQAAIDGAHAAGNRNIDRLLLRRQLSRQEQPRFDATAIKLLAAPEQNSLGAGDALLAAYYDKLGDKPQAAHWLKVAAKAGDAEAQTRYAAILIDGVGITANRNAGMTMMREGALGGDIRAMRYLASISASQGHWKEALNWLMAGAAGGDVDALLAAAQIMEYGHSGETDAVDRALRTYRALAGAGFAEARRRLAQMALDGRGMKKNPKQAEAWLQQDATKGDHASEAQLGAGYLGGDFGAVNEAEGVRWLELAIKGGNTDAHDAYAEWLLSSRKTSQARRQAIGLLQQAITLGSNSAPNNLAWALCTTRDDAIRDPVSGLAVLRKLGEPGDLPLGTMDTDAACRAANGDFAGAASLQEQVIRQYQALQDNGTRASITMDRFNARLALYRAGKAYLDDNQ